MTKTIESLEERLGRSISLLEQNYITWRNSGREHHIYVIWNDIYGDRKLCEELQEIYRAYQEIQKDQKSEDSSSDYHI
ncbi:MAG: hypothetical protein Q8Q01_02470 [archaeon]|nr:hypothetical protein [archaeon]